MDEAMQEEEAIEAAQEAAIAASLQGGGLLHLDANDETREQIERKQDAAPVSPTNREETEEKERIIEAALESVNFG